MIHDKISVGVESDDQPATGNQVRCGYIKLYMQLHVSTTHLVSCNLIAVSNLISRVYGNIMIVTNNRLQGLEIMLRHKKYLQNINKSPLVGMEHFNCH